MQYNTSHVSTFCQVQSAYHFPKKSLPQRPKLQVPLKGTFHADVLPNPRLLHLTSSIPSVLDPVAQKDITNDQQPAAIPRRPVEYTLNDGPRNMPGTAAYYKSWTFRKKVNEGTNQVPGEGSEHGKDVDSDACDELDKTSRKIGQAKSLVMISSRTNLRRASTQRKVTKRMQKANRRTKFWRKLEGAQCFFDWD